ncbi:glutathione S-transferase N-terminal domain-containing protein [Synechocystis sp. PCC 7339]|uniref:glutathione binding-like protein n=1 Tax=unclassified Synechocystis TaxID=2640012 RepID=UPI001BB0916D|nr:MULTISPECIES: glutathione binding-like protein [unclassified Synechocystis]QUS59560.1 glutathione S-transferase N-terminal domain-containing protein [Synechocystis sp. PCC 7338]UAJ71746.1 glutathione S-transferase N-terminal domain-containing protein [Synechocystis sp. PCC 7339]
MIDLYTYTTPNGRKPAILLEELALPYTIHKIDIGKGDQFTPEFKVINPNSKIPAIGDRDNDLTIFESGAILIYLAEKTGKLLPTDTAGRFKVMEWLMFQMASVGPIFGQLGHFRNAAPEKMAYAVERYHRETLRLLDVLDRQLENSPYIAGGYSIADIATYPWVAAAQTSYLDISTAAFPHIDRWVDTMQQRPAVQVGMNILQPGFKSNFGTLAVPDGASQLMAV